MTGSVVEFAFGPGESSYFATNNPHPAIHADIGGIGSMEEYVEAVFRAVNGTATTFHSDRMNMPTYVLDKITQIKPRYIMNLAIGDGERLFMYCYRRQRYTYDSKWFPNKPSADDGKIGRKLKRLKEEEIDQKTYCAFSQSADFFFLRSTDENNVWHPRPSRKTSR